MKTPFIPIRRDEIAEIARHLKEKYRDMTIDEVAEKEDIILVREPDASSKKAGYSVTFPRGKRRKRIPSLARPGTFIVSVSEWDTIFQDAIVINTEYRPEPPPAHPLRGVHPPPHLWRGIKPLEPPSTNVEGGWGVAPVVAPSEEEIFWHEFYHLWYSPTVNNARFHNGDYSTAGALDAQEERRANEFAKAMLES
jgi:hypothetical protein